IRYARRHFDLPAPPDIVGSLERAARAAGDTRERDWARETLDEIARRSPVSIWASDLLLRLDYEELAPEGKGSPAGGPSGRASEWLGYLRESLARTEVEAAWLVDQHRSMPRALALAVEYLF